MNVSKEERLRVFLQRLGEAPAVGSFEDAYELLARTLNSVEDEMSGVVANPESWESDGRMYPPQMDSARDVEGRVDLTRFRSRGHHTFIRENGAIEIRDLKAAVLFSKLGLDGNGVDYE